MKTRYFNDIMRNIVLASSLIFFTCHTLSAQENEDIVEGPPESDTSTSLKSLKEKRFIEKLTYQTQPGLPIAASKIYHSDRNYTISGFGEVNYIGYTGYKDRSSNDLELYYTNLYRGVSYVGWKPKDWLILYGEIFAEFMHDGNREGHFEAFIEVFADFQLDEHFNVRVGTMQPSIGYINNHDEPVMFYSVNRPDVERIIIPTQWIDLGIMTYGKINDELNWTFSTFQGLDAQSFNGGTWMRRGRDDEFRMNLDNVALNSQLNYSGIENTTLSASGYWTRSGGNESIETPQGTSTVNANTLLTTAYGRLELDRWNFMLLGAYGRMGDTDKLYQLTDGQVLGKEVYGALFEVGYDILPFFRGKQDAEGIDDDGGLIFNKHEMKLPLFARYERLNTHHSVHSALLEEERSQNDLHALTVGLNFNTQKDIVLKANYMFRWNQAELPSGRTEGDRIEVGMGFIF